MADTLEAPITRPDDAAGKRGKDDLLNHLDELLERYLHTLHEYQQQMQQLSKQLSSGYMSLAQANFHNSSSALRYGQDCYDERMQAIRKVYISEHDRGTSDCPRFSVHQSESPNEKAHASDTGSTDKDAAKTEASESGCGISDSKAEEEKENSKASTGEGQPSAASGESKEEKKTIQKPTDPLKWFGILVPPALRAAQSTFVGAVEGPIPRLATIARDLRMQEIEIGRVRKQIKKM